jgi:hypothetical protein
MDPDIRLAFVGVVAWLTSIATDYWVIIVGELLSYIFMFIEMFIETLYTLTRPM